MELKPTSGIVDSTLIAPTLPPAPDVPASELATRVNNIRTEMDADKIDVIVLTDVKNIRYFTDFSSVAWYFNSRPFFVVITATELIFFAADYEQVYVESKPRGFSARYYAGYANDGATCVAGAVRDLFKGSKPTVAIDYGEEMAGRGSLPLIEGLRILSRDKSLQSATPTLWRVRQIKTRFEADLKRTAFSICDSAFDKIIAETEIGVSEIEMWRKMQAQTFLNGADEANPPPLIFGKGNFTYSRPPSDRRLEEGHYIWADFRATYGGYSADRNRIARVGEPTAQELETYRAVRDVTHEWCHLVRPGMTCAEVYEEGNKLWAPMNVGNKFSLHKPGAVGVRVGHASGLDLVEKPDLGPEDHTVIRPGMILHIEPKLERDGGVYQCEEVFYVLEDGIDFLAPLTPETLRIID